MRVSTIAVIAALVLPSLSGCDSDGDSATPPAQSFKGWVPAPSSELTSYAECLSREGVAVERVVGRFILLDDIDLKEGELVDEKCAKERDIYRKTVSATDFKIPDQDGYRFISQVRSCVAQAGVELSETATLITKEPKANLTAFNSCVEEIRAIPTPTD